MPWATENGFEGSDRVCTEIVLLFQLTKPVENC